MTVANYKARLDRNKRTRESMIQYNRESDNETCQRGRWVENPKDGLRFVGDAHDVYSHIGHTGWFVDQHQDEKVCGEVYQLPSRNGLSLFVAAISDSCGNDGSLILFHETSDDKEECARMADRAAEIYAEHEREWHIKDAAESRVESIKEEIEELYAGFKAMAVEVRANCDKLTGMSELKKLLHREYRRVRSNVRKLRAEAKKLAENPYAIDPRY